MTDMPPVNNRLLYIYRTACKVWSIFIFGVACVLLIFPVIPVMRIIFRPAERFMKNTRKLVSFFFRIFISMTEILGALKFECPDKNIFSGMRSKIVVSNHPSLLDMVMYISQIPNANVIVGMEKRNSVIKGVVRRLYIPSDLDFDNLCAACDEAFSRGENLVIFPEGTRTPRNKEMRLKRVAARISLLTGREIVVAHMGGTDKYGLGKNDPLFSFNHTDIYIYRIRIQKIINPEKYAGMEIHRAVRRLNAEILELFLHPVFK